MKKNEPPKSLIERMPDLSHMQIVMELRNLAAELGLVLVYEITDPDTKEIAYQDLGALNFADDLFIATMKNGELHMSPMPVNILIKKMERAITRIARNRHIKETQEKYGVEPR